MGALVAFAAAESIHKSGVSRSQVILNQSSTQTGKTFNVSSATIAQVHSSTYSINGSSAMMLVDFYQRQVGASSSTITTTFVPTGLEITVRPKSSRDIFWISAQGTLSHSRQGFSAVATITRDGSNLFGTVGGCNMQTSSGTATVPCSMTIWDAPSTASTVTYRVEFRTASGTGTSSWGASSSETTSMSIQQWAR